jgi:hypothetical protein
MIYAMLSADPLLLEEPRGVGRDQPRLGVWPALRSTALLLASCGLVLIGVLSLVGPSDSLSDRALRRACYALDDHLAVASCSAPFPVLVGVDLDVTAAFLLAGTMAALFLWSMRGYWRLCARSAAGLVSWLFRS